MLLELMKNNYLEYVKINLTSGTLHCYKSNLDTIFQFFKQNNIIDSDNIDNLILTKFINYSRNRSNTNRSINLRIQILKNMFKYNNIENNFLFSFIKLREDRNTFGYLTVDEINKLIDYLNISDIKIQNKLLIFMLIDTGMRINEALNVKISNINFSNKTIYLEKTKNHKYRYVPFTELTSKILLEYLNKINSSYEYLFDISYDAVKSCFYRIGKKLGFNKFHPHMLRHSLASLLHKNGASVMIIQKILGHSSISITERYIHFDIEQIINVYSKTMHF